MVKSTLAVKIVGGVLVAFTLTGGGIALAAANTPAAPTLEPGSTSAEEDGQVGDEGQAGEEGQANQEGEQAQSGELEEANQDGDDGQSGESDDANDLDESDPTPSPTQ